MQENFQNETKLEKYVKILKRNSRCDTLDEGETKIFI